MASRTDRNHEAPERILLCLGPCHGEFYLPLDRGDRIECPNDVRHPVAVYRPYWYTQGLSE